MNLYATQPTSSYNYYKHGYDTSNPRYYYHYPSNSSVIGNQAASALSDDNPHACSIMWISIKQIIKANKFSFWLVINTKIELSILLYESIRVR